MTHDGLFLRKGSQQGAVAQLVDPSGNALRKHINEPRYTILESAGFALTGFGQSMQKVVTGFSIPEWLKAVAHADPLPEWAKGASFEFLLQFRLAHQEQAHQFIFLRVQVR